MSDIKVPALVLDPLWRVGKVMLGEAQCVVLGITHPEHGELHFYLPPSSLSQLAAVLAQQQDVVPPPPAAEVIN